jgi:hypothetical protein
MWYELVVIGHASLTVLSFALLFSNNRKILWFLLVFLSTCLLSFVILGGCFITRYEQKISGTSFTLIDPFLETLGFPVDKFHRNLLSITAYVGAISVIAVKLS